MSIPRLASELLSDSVLPYVIHVHGLGIPYPAQLWIGGVPQYKKGVASLHVGENGYLTAEYFAYDADDLYDRWGIRLFGDDNRDDRKLVFSDTQVEVPTATVETSRKKARTLYNALRLPQVVVYECRILGWLGVPNCAMDSATMLISGFPDIHMPSLTQTIPERPSHGSLTLRGTEVSNSVLTLEAGGWLIRLEQSTSSDNDRVDVTTVAHVSRQDGSSFILDDPENSILQALQMFLSFQCGAWVNNSLVIPIQCDVTMFCRANLYGFPRKRE